MRRLFGWLFKPEESAPLRLEHVLLLLLGIILLLFTTDSYRDFHPVAQVIVLIAYVGALVGIAPVPMPVFKRKRTQIIAAGAFSGVLDSYIVLDQFRRVRTVEAGQTREEVLDEANDQETTGVRGKFLALVMIAALIGGLIIWFGEVYAAGVFINDGRTGLFSALYIIPPVLLFLWVLGMHAERLPIEVVQRPKGERSPQQRKRARRDAFEFTAGVALLLITHNPLLGLGVLIVYAVLSRQDDRLIDVVRHHTEVNVMLVLVIALIAGGWLVTNVIEPLGLGEGAILPIIPAGVQAVLWGPLYADPTVHFWIRILTLSTGALLLPISSLVGVMLFKTMKQWRVYMRYSFIYAAVWYAIFRVWIWLTLETPFAHALEQWAHSGGAH